MEETDSLLNETLDRGLQLRDVVLRVETLADDYFDGGSALSAGLLDRLFGAVDGLVHVQAVQVDRARR